MRTTNIRFTGLASGLDTETMVQSLVMPYKMKADSAKQGQTLMEWRKDAWRDMNKQLFAFYDTHLNKMRMEGSFNKKNVTISHPNIIEIGENQTLPEGTHTIDKITQLAESAKVQTSSLATANGSKVTENTKLSELVDDKKAPILAAGEEITLKVSDSVDDSGNPIYKEVKLSGDMTVGQMERALKDAMPNSNVNFDDTASAFFISTKKTGASQSISFGGDTDKAFKLLGINEGKFTSTVETVTGKITYSVTENAKSSTKLKDIGITQAELANGNKLAVDFGGKALSVELNENMTIAQVEEAINKQIQADAELKDKATFKYNDTTGKFEAKDTVGTDVSLKVIKPGVDGTADVDNDVLITKVNGQLQHDVKKTATGATTFKDLGIDTTSPNNKFAVTLKSGTEDVVIEIDITETTTLEGLAKDIQKKIDADPKVEGQKFSFDTKNGRFSMQTDATTSFGQADKLGIQNGVAIKEIKGVNAELSYNGVQMSSETNTITVNGFNFTIKSTTQPDEAITIVSSLDTDAVVDYVKDFVDAYNKLIMDIHIKLDAPSSKGYEPLTEEQKKEMSESEIEAWEKKIKDSLFRGDNDLEKITNQMRNILGSTVEGNAFGSLAAIGISTGDWKEDGKLHFDEEKFKKALAKDFDAVTDLFAGKNGVIDKLYDTITEQTKSSEQRSAYSFYNDKLLNDRIKDQKDEVYKLEQRMYRMENMYYKQFTAMEKMMSQLNNQSNWLMSQVGGM